MRRPPARWLLALAVVTSSRLDAQPAPQTAMGKLVRVSDVRSDWLNEGVESPNGRFYLLKSYASNDSGFLRYDRVKRSWADLGRDNVGRGARWSPNGRFILFGRGSEESRELYVWVMPIDTATGLASGPARRVSTRWSNSPAAWSPDSRRIAFTARDSGGALLVTVPFNGGDEQVLYRAPGVMNTPAWSPDGRYLFIIHKAPDRAPRTVRISLTDKRAVDMGEAKAPIIDISPDGKWLAQYVWFRPVLHLLSTDGQSARKVELNSTLSRLAPSGWSHANPNEMVAVDHFAPTAIQRVSIADGLIRTVVAFDSGGLAGAALSPDERQLAYIRLRDGVAQLVVSDTNGRNVRVLADGARGDVQWSPTGQHIAYRTAETDVRIVEVSSKKTRALILAEREPCPERGPSCDGRLPFIVWRSDAHALRYFERRTTKDAHALELHEVDLEGRHRLIASTNVAGDPAFITGNDTLFLVQPPGSGNGTASGIQVVNSRTGAARVIYSGNTRLQGQVAANGQWILIVAESGGNGTPLVEQPFLVSLTTGESKKYPYALGGEVSHGYFMPDGRNFLLIACVTCRDPNYVEKWDLILTPMNGDPPRILTGSESAFKDFWPVAVTKDGRTAYFTAEQSYNTRIVTFALPK